MIKARMKPPRGLLFKQNDPKFVKHDHARVNKSLGELREAAFGIQLAKAIVWNGSPPTQAHVSNVHPSIY